MALLTGLFKAEDGSIVVMGALALTAVLGMSGLGVEVANGYTAKIRNQRVADMAALGAAVAFKSSQNIATATATANDIVVANGLPSASATVSQTTVGGASAIQVMVQTTVPIRLAQVLTSQANYTVANTAVASLVSGGGMSGCLQALSSSPTNGISLAPGARITASGCAVNTNAGIDAPNGAYITAQQVNAGKTISDGGAPYNAPAVTTTPTARNIRQNQANAATDTVGTDARVIAGFAKLGTYTSPSANTSPTTPTGTDWTFPNNSATFGQLPSSDPVRKYCTISGTAYTCSGGSYAIRTLGVPNGVGVTFTGSSNITVSKGINNTGNKLTFGGGSFVINGTIQAGIGGIAFGNADVATGSGITVGAGGLTIGTGNVTVNGALQLGASAIVTMGKGTHSFNSVSVSNSARLTLGEGALNINGPLTSDGGGSSIAFGAGSYTIGRDASGNSVTVSNGSSMSFGDGAFSANGNVITSGGSAIVFGVTASHYINGNLNLNGTSTFGAGAYYVNGLLTNNTGGAMTGSGVTFFLAGTFTLAGGTSMTLSAPTTDSGGGITDLLVATKSNLQTRLGGGSKNTYAGLVYAPNSSMVMDGGAGATGGGRCFMLVVGTFSMNGGAAAGTACATLGAAAAAGSVALLQ